MPEFADSTIQLFGRFTKRAEVQSQGGLLNGEDPTAYNTADPLRIWIVQVGIIIMMTQLLYLGLRKIKQPRVISEILGGILLGPTAFGRIPGFTNHIFPAASIPYLTLVANIGLCLFLFIIGLEIDASIIRRNARLSVVVSLAGILLPFGVGAAISKPLYEHFSDSSVHYPYFMLFVGVSYSITAFPVLCRILTELQLLDTTVGLIVLSAGVANDVVAWTLLALSIALVNATSGLTALWTFLVCVAFALFLLFPVKRIMLWLAHKTGSTVNGPTMFYMTVVMIVLWASSFFTDIVGVNAIFGAFLVGVIIPREGGLAIALTEKLEDMVSIIFLPLYFTLSGLKTDLGLLNDGAAWGFMFVLAALDFTGKFTSCTLSSRYLGFSWRESSTVGGLMSCKGLVELIVLNAGLSAGILNERVFSMFVLDALILTFLTTPIVNLLYPPERRTRPGDAQVTETATPPDEGDKVVDDDQASLVAPNQSPLAVPPAYDDSNTSSARKPEYHVDALRLIELSQRTSAVMKSSDPLLSVFKMFGEESDIPVSTSLAVVPYDEMAASVADHARRNGSQLVLIPWLAPIAGSTTSAMDAAVPGTLPAAKLESSNPFEALFGSGSKANESAAALRSQFIRGVFSQSRIDVAVFVDTGDRVGTRGPQHILCPFFGGPDDRLALDFVVQLCANPRISATIVRATMGPVEVAGLQKPVEAIINDGLPVISTIGLEDSIYPYQNTESRLQSDTADSVLWARYAGLEKYTVGTHLQAALSRITFEELTTPVPLQSLIQRVHEFREVHRRVLVVTGRSRSRTTMSGVTRYEEVKTVAEKYGCAGGGNFELVRKTVGDVGCALLVSGAPNAMVVVQAGVTPVGEA
ncbi:Sodium/hydrogen exchanger family-domain-containing protein [Pisolithus orientalis]|uniref:Sodium/hydrogen exchanger family-domain-containing protein n=1 Tax=Pisolithus orientalis TaxID=936130 RepID=UPI002225B024|nr:Sodium/hydrogen exchanger family-domain-containing protein [Pisolithus orientalis]KAI6030489.1 Sodium/hydrogen exchanger family-domain-containing protein [Pisolithus orientalis]